MTNRTATATITASDLRAARLAAGASKTATVRLISGRTFGVTTDDDSFMLVTLDRDTVELNPDHVAGAEHGGFMLRSTASKRSSNPDCVAGATEGGFMVKSAR